MLPDILPTRRFALAGTLLFTSLLASANPAIDSVDWVADGRFTQGVEGPVVDRQGNLYAVNFARQGTIGKVTPDGEANEFIALPGGSVGNGLRFNNQGDLLVADYVNHNVLKIDMNSHKVSVFAHHPGMNQPNDIAISDQGILYASDPNWAENSGQLWMISVDGQSHLIDV